MDYVFNEELDNKFKLYTEAKRILSQTNNNYDNGLLDLGKIRLHFLAVSLGTLLAYFNLFKYSKNKIMYYYRKRYYRNIFIKVIPITIVGLVFLKNAMENYFEYIVKKNFVEKILENEKDSVNYKNRRKLLLNQLNYYLKKSDN